MQKMQRQEINYFVAIPVAVITILIILFVSGVARADTIDLGIIAQIESSGRTRAYNNKTQATGMYQITPICLADYNAYHVRQYKLSDMFSEVKAREVAQWYLNQRIPELLRHYGHADTTINRLICYNAGIKRLGRRLPAETSEYIQKYERRQT